MTAEAATTILIVEDQGLMRSAIAALLDLEDDLSVVAEVSSVEQVLPTASAVRPDVVLLDIELRDGSGLDIIDELVHTLPGTRVIVVTTFGRPGYLKRALESGARGFLVKDDPVGQLAAAIRRVLAGEIVVNPLLAAHALSARANPLTDREQDVLRAASGGATIADIAARLRLSPSTVRNYLSSAIGKTAARNRTESYSIARDNGWL